MRRLWKGLLLGSLLAGAAYLIARQPMGAAGQGKAKAAQRTLGHRVARSLKRQLRDVQGAVRVGRRLARRKRLWDGATRLARRLQLI